MKSNGFFIIVVLYAVFYGNALVNAQSGLSENWQESEARTVTLYSRAKNDDRNGGYGKSAFSFWHGLRSDVGTGVTRNNFEIVYGGMNISGDSDWFTVTLVTDDCGRIRDLGELDWTEIFEVPYLPAAAEPDHGITMSFKSGNLEQSSNGQFSKVILGHMYVLHTKDSVANFYTLFRVDKLKPSDEATISWKNVPSPFND